MSAGAGHGQTYRHMQFGGVVVVALGIAIAGLVVVNETMARNPATLAVEILLLACLALFYCLRVEVDDRSVSVRFGVGLIRRRIALDDVAAARAVRNRWYCGWGVRRIPGGWMFNVAGLDAVELVFRNGRRFRIGTDEPDALERAIRSRLPRSGRDAGGGAGH